MNFSMIVKTSFLYTGELLCTSLCLCFLYEEKHQAQGNRMKRTPRMFTLRLHIKDFTLTCVTFRAPRLILSMMVNVRVRNWEKVSAWTLKMLIFQAGITVWMSFLHLCLLLTCWFHWFINSALHIHVSRTFAHVNKTFLPLFILYFAFFWHICLTLQIIKQIVILDKNNPRKYKMQVLYFIWTKLSKPGPLDFAKLFPATLGGF